MGVHARSDRQAIAETSAGELCFVAHLMMGNCLGGNASLNCTSVFRTARRKSGPSAQCAAHELLRQYKEGDDVFRRVCVVACAALVW